MVITVVWLQSWISMVLAVGTLLIVVFFVFFCTCFDQKKDNNTFYVIDENGIRKENVTSPCNLHGFRRLSGTPEPENAFTSKNLPFYDLKDGSKPLDLMDSMEVVKSFDTVVLRLDDYDTPRDELRSCLSNDSLNSFYSAHPSTIARGTSRESFVSLISEFEKDVYY